MNVISVLDRQRSDLDILVDELNKRTIVKNIVNLILVFPDRLAEYRDEQSLFERMASSLVDSYPYELPVGVVFIRIYLDDIRWEGSSIDGDGRCSYKIRFRAERTNTSYFI